MSKAPQGNLDRRQFIASGAVAGVAAAASVPAQAAPSLDLWASAHKAAVVLHDPRINVPQEVLRRLDANGARTLALQGDPVWFWRSAAAAPARESSTTLMGVTTWPDLLVFRGLAAETRRHLRYEKLDAATGAFIWMIS
jgi:hypothetical protein